MSRQPLILYKMPVCSIFSLEPFDDGVKDVVRFQLGQPGVMRRRAVGGMGVRVPPFFHQEQVVAAGGRQEEFLAEIDVLGTGSHVDSPGEDRVQERFHRSGLTPVGHIQNEHFLSPPG